ncbi:MAG: TetR/AcrR family transcriptional regulator [Oligoflexus sp.]
MAQVKDVNSLISPRKMAKQQRSRSLVQTLLDATARVLVSDGYDRMSTNQIACVAGVSIGSLYQYYPSKEALVAALIDRQLEQDLPKIQSRIDELAQQDINTKIAEISLFLFQLYQKDSILRRILIEEVPRIGKIQRQFEIELKVANEIYDALFEKENMSPSAEGCLVRFILTKAVIGILHGAILDRESSFDYKLIAHEVAQLVTAYIGNRQRLADT